MGLETVWTVEITLTVLAVNGTLFSRFKIGAIALIFLGTCSLGAGTTATHTRMMSGVLCIVPLTAVRAEEGPVEQCNHTSQAIEVIPMFDEVNDFIVLIHVTFEKDGTGDVIDHNDFCNLWVQETLEIFPVHHTRKGLLEHWRLDVAALLTVPGWVSLCVGYRTASEGLHPRTLSSGRWPGHSISRLCSSFFLCIILKGRRPGLLVAGPFPPLSGYVMKVSVALNPMAGFMF